MTITEAVKAMEDATRGGYSVELIINGELYEIQPTAGRKIICYEVIQAPRSTQTSKA